MHWIIYVLAAAAAAIILTALAFALVGDTIMRGGRAIHRREAPVEYWLTLGLRAIGIPLVISVVVAAVMLAPGYASPTFMAAVFVLMGAQIGYGLATSLSSGFVKVYGRTFTRKDAPASYWFWIVTYVWGLVVGTLAALAFSRMMWL